MIKRQISCDIPGCKASHLETAPGEGWPGWGILQGIALNGVQNPCLCPKHLKAAADFIDAIRVN